MLKRAVLSVGVLGLFSLPNCQGVEAARHELYVPLKTAAKPTTVRVQDGVETLPDGALARLGFATLRHRGAVRAVQFSPDGKTLASTGKDSKVCVWDTASGERLCCFSDDSSANQQAIAYSPDGKLLAWNSRAGDVVVADLEKKSVAFRLKGHTAEVNCLAFSPDGRRLASASVDLTIRLWDVAPKGDVHTLTGHQESVNAVAFTPDGKTLVSGGDDATIRFWDVATGKETRKFPWPGPVKQDDPWEGIVRSIHVSPDGACMAVIGEPDAVRLFDTATFRELRRFHGGKYSLHAALFSPDGKTLVSGGSSIWVWEISTGKLLQTLQTQPRDMAYSLSYSPNGRTLAVADWYFRVRLYDMPSGKERPRSPEHLEEIRSVGYSANGRLLGTCDASGKRLFWEAATGKGVAGPGQDAVTEDEDTLEERRYGTDALIEAHTDGVCFAGEAVLRHETNLPFKKDEIWRIVVSPDGKTLAVETFTVTPAATYIHFWDVPSAKTTYTFQYPNHENSGRLFDSSRWASQTIVFSPSGRMAAVLVDSNAIVCWDVRTGKEVSRLRGADTECLSISFSPDGRFLVSTEGEPGGGDPPSTWAIRIWEVASARQVGEITPPAPRLVNCVAWDPDGHTIAGGSLDGSVWLWDALTGRLLWQRRDPGNQIRFIAFSPDGQTLATVMTDRTVLIWNAATGDGTPVEHSNQLTEADLAGLWTKLGGENAAESWSAVATLSTQHEPTLQVLRQHLRPVLSEKPERISRLVTSLDADDFDRREAASKELAALGAQAGPALRKALAETKSEEVHARITKLLKPLGEWAVTDPDTLRSLRAIWVLERIGTPAARAVLEDLAKGAPEVRQTQEAQAALAFLDKRAAAAKP